jgi:mannose-6-phosphate isomerase-like protein (cupin superfamily)
MAADLPPAVAVCRSLANHYDWGNTCDGWVLSSHPDLLVIEEHVPAGESKEWHVHGHAQQFFYVVAGEAQLHTSFGVTHPSERSGIPVPAALAHRFVNAGTSDVAFLVVSAPSTVGDRRSVQAPMS